MTYARLCSLMRLIKDQGPRFIKQAGNLRLLSRAFHKLMNEPNLFFFSFSILSDRYINYALQTIVIALMYQQFKTENGHKLRTRFIKRGPRFIKRGPACSFEK